MPLSICTDENLGQTGCRIIKRVADDAGKDNQPHLLKLMPYNEIIDSLT